MQLGEAKATIRVALRSLRDAQRSTLCVVLGFNLGGTDASGQAADQRNRDEYSSSFHGKPPLSRLFLSAYLW